MTKFSEVKLNQFEPAPITIFDGRVLRAAICKFSSVYGFIGCSFGYTGGMARTLLVIVSEPHESHESIAKTFWGYRVGLVLQPISSPR